MTPQNQDDFVRRVGFWIVTAVFAGPWIVVLAFTFRHGVVLPAHNQWKTLSFALAYPLPWFVMLADRKRGDATVFIIGAMTYSVLMDAVAILYS